MTKNKIENAKKLLRSGELVIFPTETVYGLGGNAKDNNCLLYTSPSPRDGLLSRMPSSA